MRIRSLDTDWSFKCLNDAPDYHQPQLQRLPWLSAEVPGSVHLDLLRHGVIEDPFARMHEPACAWIDDHDWTYKTKFEWSASADLPRRVLSFRGLDTVCQIRLNGEPLANHDNMFVPLEVDVTDRLETGLNKLEIDFKSAVVEGQRRRREYFEAEGIPWSTNWFDERAFVRKAQYMSGWDWGPRLVSCGIWQPVELLEFRARIKRLSFLQEKLASGKFRVWTESEIEGEGQLTVTFGEETRGDSESCEFEVEPELWWPNGEGGQFLYQAGAVLDSGHRVDKSVGLRTIRLLRERDEIGRSFQFEVNGRPIWSRGANWIPNDSFVTRVKADQLHSQVDKYRRLGMNMLRVWGGGFYESEAFYDACDQNGLLVWQDFPYACSYYPDTGNYVTQSKDEAADQVLRLRDRTCLALWCGNNENDVLWQGKWGGAESAPPRYFGENLYRHVLPEVVAHLSPATPYIASSPIAEAPEVQDDTTSESWGDSHYWDVWHGKGDWNFYTDSKTRFSSEFGFASSCSPAAWQLALNPEDWTLGSEVVWWHDKTGKGRNAFMEYSELHYPKPVSLEDWIYYSQLNQRDAMRHAVEHYRRSEFCKGALIWQINDCWPVQSWAMEDYRRVLKAAGHELARLYAPVLLATVLNDGTLEVWAANDGPEAFEGTLEVQLFDTISGAQISHSSTAVTLKPAQRVLLQKQGLRGEPTTTRAVKTSFKEVPNSERWLLLCEPKEADLTCEISIKEADDHLLVTVTGLAYDLILWDEGNPESILNPHTRLPGWAPQTLPPGTHKYPFTTAPITPRARSLTGVHNL